MVVLPLIFYGHACSPVVRARHFIQPTWSCATTSGCQWEFRPCGEGFVINSVRSSGSFVAVQDLTGLGLCREGGAQVVAEAIPTCWKVEVLQVGPTDEVGDVFARYVSLTLRRAVGLTFTF
jgi:hypothetical protein